MPLLFRVIPGSFTVTPTKPGSYTTEEDVVLTIVCQLEAWAKDMTYRPSTWRSMYEIFTGGILLMSGDPKSPKFNTILERKHSFPLFGELDKPAPDNFQIGIGKFTAGTLSGYVTVKAEGIA